MNMAGRMVEREAGAPVALADAACPTSIKGTNSPARQPSNIVRMPKTIRPAERSL